MNYTVHWTDTQPVYQGQWDSSVWQKAETIYVDQFHPQSSLHRPKTAVKLLYDDENLYVFFRVEDRYVKAVYTQYQDPVCHDSCVEFFIMPCILICDEPQQSFIPGYRGYFNVELNCIGTMLLYYIEDWTRTADGFAEYEPVCEELVRGIRIFHSLSGRIDPEIDPPVEWFIGYNLPFSLFENYLGILDIRKGRYWRGNFYKCADHSSHPHWASWAPIGTELNFHQPQYFGTFEFGI